MYSSTNDAAMAGVAIVALIFLAVIAAYAVIGITRIIVTIAKKTAANFRNLFILDPPRFLIKLP